MYPLQLGENKAGQRGGKWRVWKMWGEASLLWNRYSPRISLLDRIQEADFYGSPHS